MSKIYTKPFIRSNDDWNLFGQVRAPLCSESFVDPIIDGYINSYENYLQDKFIQQIGFDIVAESVFDYPYPYISEKTFRPILNKKLFLLIAPAHTLKLLHSYGFKTFSPFIDESYDLIQDPIKRIQKTFDEINRLCSISLDEIKENTLLYADILNHNYQNLLQLQNNSIQRLKEQINDSI